MNGTLVFPQPSIPLWLSDLYSIVSAEQHHPFPSVRFKLDHKRALYQGHAWIARNHIYMRFNSSVDTLLQRKVALHEYAHLLTSHKHDEQFYVQAYRLYARYDVPILFAYFYERRYKLMGRLIGAEFLAGLQS